MAKELLLYSGIYSFTAESLINQMNDFAGEDLVLRINSPGGSVDAGWGIIAKMQELSKAGTTIKVKVDGGAYSMAADVLLFADDVEALDVSTIMFHRADMYVSNEVEQAYLDGINAKLKTKMLGKINADLFKEVTGITVDELFDPKQRVNVFLDAKQAKKLGIVQRITKLSPTEAAAIAQFNFDAVAISDNSKTTKNTKPMTLDEFKAAHPAIYAEAVKQGEAQERDRVLSWTEFSDVDPKAVADGIASGKDISKVEYSKFVKAGMTKASAETTEETEEQKAAKAKLAEVEKTSTKTVDNKEPEATTKTEEATAVADFEKSVKDKLGLKV